MLPLVLISRGVLASNTDQILIGRMSVPLTYYNVLLTTYVLYSTLLILLTKLKKEGYSFKFLPILFMFMGSIHRPIECSSVTIRTTWYR